MKTIELRNSLKKEFAQLGIDAVDADFLIAEQLKVKITDLPLIEEVDDAAVMKIYELAREREMNKPLDKIFGFKYFYKLKFDVNENVLSPRQESELLVDEAIKIIKEKGYKTALDLCTGSGCLAVAIKRNTDVEMTASDVSSKALAVAKQNAYKNNAVIKFVRSDMFKSIDGSFDIIVSNPPYISSDDIKELPDEVKLYDPLLALDGGEMGLKFYNMIHDNVRNHLNDGGALILEIGEDQNLLVQDLFNDFNLVDCIKDYNGLDRVMIFTK